MCKGYIFMIGVNIPGRSGNGGRPNRAALATAEYTSNFDHVVD